MPNSDVVISVTWKKNEYTINIRNPKGGKLVVQNTTQNTSVSVNSNSNYNLIAEYNDNITITPIADSSFNLVDIKDNTTSINSTKQLTVTQNTTISSSWKRDDYFLFRVDQGINNMSFTSYFRDGINNYNYSFNTTRTYMHNTIYADNIRVDIISDALIDVTDYMAVCAENYVYSSNSSLTNALLAVGLTTSKSSWLTSNGMFAFTTSYPELTLAQSCYTFSNSGSYYVGLQYITNGNTGTATFIIHHIILLGKTYS